MLERIKATAEILLTISSASDSQSATKPEHTSNNSTNVYESMLQKMEAEIRTHIRTEYQLKLYIESAKTLIDEHQNEIKQLKTANKKLTGEIAEITANMILLQNKLNKAKVQLLVKAKEMSALLGKSTEENLSVSELIQRSIINKDGGNGKLTAKLSTLVGASIVHENYAAQRMRNSHVNSFTLSPPIKSTRREQDESSENTNNCYKSITLKFKKDISYVDRVNVMFYSFLTRNRTLYRTDVR